MRAFAVAAAAAALASPAAFLHARQGADGGFAEPGGRETVGLTAWAAIGLRASGAPTGPAADYLAAHEGELRSTTDVALGVLAEAALGQPSPGLLQRLRQAVDARAGRIGPTVNSTIWGVLALRQADLRAPGRTARWLLARQRPSGGWPWYAGGQADSNDTAAAIEALRALGARGRPVARGLAYLRRLQNRDGGFELSDGRGSDAQSTAWAIQAFIAAGRPPGAAAFRYLAHLRRPDGSYRYTARYATTPVWVTAQVLAALARKPFPLR